jgi:hypothetical protein
MNSTPMHSVADGATARPIAAPATMLALLIVVLLAGLPGAPLAHAQTPVAVLVGGGVSGGIGIESADVPVYAGDGDCGTFEEGSSASGAIDGRLVLPTFFGPSVGLDARLRLGFGSAQLTAAPPVATTVREGGALVELDREFRMDRSTVSASVDLLARFAAGPLSLGAGASLGARLSSTFEQTDNILGPGASAFSDGSTSIAMTTASTESSTFIVAPIVAAGYPIAFGTGGTLIPELSLRFDLLSSLQDGSWRSVEPGLGIGILFDLTPAATPIREGGG